MRPSPIPALMRLNTADPIPRDGFLEPSLSVELTSDRKLRSAWTTKVDVLGPTPWHRGEERYVEFLIDSTPFNDYVTCWRPLLYACLNGEIIGELRILDIKTSARSEVKRIAREKREDSRDRYPESGNLHREGS